MSFFEIFSSSSERVTDYITRFDEGIKTLQDNEINLLTIDDVPGWMLMREASWTQGRRETVDCRSARRTLQNQ